MPATLLPAMQCQCQEVSVLKLIFEVGAKGVETFIVQGKSLPAFINSGGDYAEEFSSWEIIHQHFQTNYQNI